MRLAASTSSPPGTVACACLPRRSISRKPKRRSSSRICRLIAGCVRLSRRAAAEKLPRSTTSMRVRSWSKLRPRNQSSPYQNIETTNLPYLRSRCKLIRLAPCSKGHMSEDNELSCVVGSIYDAALDPARWTDDLARIAEFVGGRAGALGSKDMVTKFVGVDHHVGRDLQYMQMHSEAHGEFDPLASGSRFDVGQVVRPPELMPLDDCDGRCCREWARPQRRGDIAGAVRERSGKSCKFLSVVRSEANDMVDHEMHRRMSLVAPHARRAVLIGRTIDQKADEVATLADAIDSLSAGVFLIEA